MSNSDISFYSISDGMLDTVSRIMGNLNWLSSINGLEKLPSLRKENRIKAVYSSLAFENSAITIEQVSDILNGKKVAVLQGDLNEVYNMFSAYERLTEVDPRNADGLLRVHKIMFDGLVADAGRLRTKDGEIHDLSGEIIHIAPPCEFVADELVKLFEWVQSSPANMLAKASVCHYELQFIQPFNVGNFRMAMLWQAALLCSWNPIFAWIPVEGVVEARKEEYYKAIAESTSSFDSGAFVKFMIEAIDTAVKDVLDDVKNHLYHTSGQVVELMKVIESYPQSANELMDKLKLKSRLGFRKNYLQPALDLGLVIMTEPDKPTSKNQKYYKG